MCHISRDNWPHILFVTQCTSYPSTPIIYIMHHTHFTSLSTNFYTIHLTTIITKAPTRKNNITSISYQPLTEKNAMSLLIIKLKPSSNSLWLYTSLITRHIKLLNNFFSIELSEVIIILVTLELFLKVLYVSLHLFTQFLLHLIQHLITQSSRSQSYTINTQAELPVMLLLIRSHC